MAKFTTLKIAAAVLAISSSFAPSAHALGGPQYATDDGGRHATTKPLVRESKPESSNFVSEQAADRRFDQQQAAQQRAYNRQAELAREQQRQAAEALRMERERRASNEYQQQMVRDQALRSSPVFDAVLGAPGALPAAARLAFGVVKDYANERRLDNTYGQRTNGGRTSNDRSDGRDFR